MALPLSFLAGLVLLMLHAELNDSLPGEESAVRLVACLAFLVLPWLLARHVSRRLARLAAGGASGGASRVALRAPAIAVPVCYGVLLFGGGYPAFVTRWSPESQTVQLVLLFAPLFLMEATVRWAERASMRWIETMKLPSTAVLGPDRLRMALFVTTPFLALAVVADLLSLNRGAEIFFRETSLGVTAGLLLLVASLCVALPLVFRLIMPVSRALPPAVAGDLRRTAAALGFRGESLLAMRTGYRVVNAALVGPAPWPRFLVLTDGLLALLDPLSLRGVVAHEVGHARANHPVLLVLVFGVLPLLLFFPLMTIDLAEVGTVSIVIASVAGLGVGAVMLRLLAHRFEHEADQLSAEALGGAAYCVQALRCIGELSPRTAHRSSFRHPSESRRIRHLFECEQDPAYRAGFWRRGQWLRRTIYGAVVLALGCCVWSQFSLWPVDRATYLFYCGRLEEAQRQLAALPSDLPEPQRLYAERLGSEVEAGLTLSPGVRSWDEVRDVLAPAAYARAEDLLVRGGNPELAVPWLSISLYKRDPEDWLQSLYLYCRAVEQDDESQKDRILRHLLALETPEQIKDVLN